MVAAPKSVQVALDLKFFRVTGTWEPSDAERKAAWELYVELVTRVGVVDLRDGLSREALSSMYQLFQETRAILRSYGPAVAQPRRSDGLSFGFLAVGMLNTILRPFLAHWHPALSDWESQKDIATSQMAHERAWPRDLELRDSLRATGAELREFLGVLAEVCGVPHALQLPSGS